MVTRSSLKVEKRPKLTLKPNFPEICKKLKPRNVDLTCVRKGVTVDCDADLLAGTVVRPRCKPQHHEESSVHYRDMTCDADGDWSDQLFVCVPGKKKKHHHRDNINIYVINPVIVLNPQSLKEYLKNISNEEF